MLLGDSTVFLVLSSICGVSFAFFSLENSNSSLFSIIYPMSLPLYYLFVANIFGSFRVSLYCMTFLHSINVSKILPFNTSVSPCNQLSPFFRLLYLLLYLFPLDFFFSFDVLIFVLGASLILILTVHVYVVCNLFLMIWWPLSISNVTNVFDVCILQKQSPERSWWSIYLNRIILEVGLSKVNFFWHHKNVEQIGILVYELSFDIFLYVYSYGLFTGTNRKLGQIILFGTVPYKLYYASGI